MEKTVEQIDTWFRDAVKSELGKIPQMVQKLAKGNGDHLQVVAESIARKTAFRVAVVKPILIDLLHKPNINLQFNAPFSTELEEGYNRNEN